ncbi:hypothetical protein ACGF8B_41825 [Streptomyces sp. NPDC047917]|uniref:hypothetical protein n=1 Tax=Streptomyces TaxID=1883 RepID=UPI0021A8DE9D|nr:hypothetical protein [Streptomyces atratus]MCT2548658.1 hypothetical protein [Streptomyces atratus]
MNTFTTWKELSKGDGDEVVLAVDFDATGRGEARFSDFVPLMDPGHTVLETLPQAVASSPDTPADAYIKQWVDEIRASGKRVRAILAFCAGATYAAAMAVEIEKTQGNFPQTILFDPERAAAAPMYWQFHKAVGQMEAVLGAAEVGPVQDAAQRATEECTSLTDLARRLLLLYHTLARTACEKLGLDERRRAEMTETAGGFLAYLSTAEQIDPTAAWKKCTAITSNTPTSGLNGFRALNPGHDADLVAEEIHFDVPHVEILSTPDIARTVSGLLAG